MSIIDNATSGAPAPTSPPVDPYGVDLAFGATGDLVVNASGSLTGVGGAFNCAQALALRLRTTPGEVPLHPQYGSACAKMFVGSKTNVAGLVLQINADLQTMLAEDPRFATATVTSFASPAGALYDQDSVLIGATARLSGGETVTLNNVTDPSPSDVDYGQIVDPSVDPTLTYDPMMEQEFFADQPEFDELQDTNMIQNIIDNTPGASIIGTSGGA